DQAGHDQPFPHFRRAYIGHEQRHGERERNQQQKRKIAQRRHLSDPGDLDDQKRAERRAGEPEKPAQNVIDGRQLTKVTVRSVKKERSTKNEEIEYRQESARQAPGTERDIDQNVDALRNPEQGKNFGNGELQIVHLPFT